MKITSGKIAKAQKVVVYGPEGIGKSTFGAQFPNPLFSDTEGSTAHLDVARFDKATSWAMLMNQIDYVKQNKPCSTYVIDTADWAEKLCKEYVIGQSPNCKSIEDFGYGKGYTILAEEWGRFLNRLQELVDIGINVVILAHAMMRKFEQPSETGAYDRWELKLEKKTAPLTKEWADAVLFATYEIYVVNVDGQGASKGKNKAQGGARVMHTTHNPAWDAKNRWGLDNKVAFEFGTISDHIKVFGDTETKPVQAPPQQPSVDAEETEHAPTVSMSPDATVDSQTAEYNENYGFFPKALRDLLYAEKVTATELQYVISMAGHYPAQTPLRNLDPEYVKGALIAQWDKVIAKIKENRNLPF